MVYISIKDIKKNTFNLDLLIEESFNESIFETINNFENIKSGLFFKLQKTNKELLKIKVQNISKEKILKNLNKIKIREAPEIEQFVEQLNEIKREEIVIKILEIFHELHTDNKETLNLLLASENPSDWLFLVEFFLIENNLPEYQKFIDNMVGLFERALDEKNILQMKDIFKIFFILKKENILVNLFIMSLGIFKAPKILRKGYKRIDLDVQNGRMESNWFFTYLKEVKDSFETDILNFLNIFSGQERFNISLLIYNKLFEDNISTQLDLFLNEEEGITFLLYFELAFMKLQELAEHIENIIDIKCDYKSLFEHHKTVAMRIEIEGLKFIYNIICGKITNSKYYISNNLIGKGNKKDNFIAILSYFELILRRKILIPYDEKDFSFIFNNFQILYMKIVFANLGEEMEDIGELSSFYLILLKYFEKKNMIFDRKEFDLKLKEIFNSLIEKESKVIISKVRTLNVESTTDDIIEYIDELKKKSIKYLRGSNGQIFIHSMLLTFQAAYCEQILNFRYTEKLMKLAESENNKLRKLFNENNFTSTVEEYLPVIYLSENKVLAYINNCKIPVEKINQLIRCRYDYAKIKNNFK